MRALKLTPRVPVPPEDLLSPEKARIMIEEKNMAAVSFINLKISTLKIRFSRSIF